MPTVKKPQAPVKAKSSPIPLVAATPEAVAPVSKRRTRLAKAFTRPLDKSLKRTPLVREKYSLPEGEYVRLVDMKKRLAEQGVAVKKSELVRAGLALLASLDDDDRKSAITRVLAIGPPAAP